MIDDHTKAILTVIAASLLVLAVQQVVKPASAQIGGQCDYSRDVPCYITIIPPGNRWGEASWFDKPITNGL
jgi:hypothetical protein